jgi:hypothetical protein
MNNTTVVKRCRACGRIGQTCKAPVEECSFCGSRLLEATGSIIPTPTRLSGTHSVSTRDSGPPVTEVRRISACLWSAAALQLFSGLFFLSLDPSLIPIGQVASVIGLVTGAIGLVQFLRSVHQAWQQLDAFSPATLRQNGLGSPGLIIGLLFVPLFNLFWMFTVFCGWNRVARQILDDHLIAGERPNGRHALHFCLVSLFSPFAVVLMASVFGMRFGLTMNWCLALLSVFFLKSMLEEMVRTGQMLASAHPLSVGTGKIDSMQHRFTVTA